MGEKRQGGRREGGKLKYWEILLESILGDVYRYSIDVVKKPALDINTRYPGTRFTELHSFIHSYKYCTIFSLIKYLTILQESGKETAVSVVWILGDTPRVKSTPEQSHCWMFLRKKKKKTQKKTIAFPPLFVINKSKSPRFCFISYPTVYITAGLKDHGSLCYSTVLCSTDTDTI